MSPVLSKEGKSDGLRYKKMEYYEKHEELASPAFFLYEMKRTQYICLIFLFLVTPKKKKRTRLNSLLLNSSSPAPSVSPLSVPLPG